MDLNNIQYVYVATDIARQATTIHDKASATYIKDGEMVITDLAGNVLTTTAASYAKDKVKLVFRKGTSIISSPAISYKNVTKYLVNAYAASLVQISYLGYNGTTGDLEGGVLTTANDYIVTLTKKGITSNMGQDNDKSAQWYNEILTTGQAELADGLTGQLITNFNADFQVDNFVIFERVCSSAATVLGGTSTLKVVNGSKTAIASSASHGLVAGSYVRIGGTATTTPVYKVVSVSTTTITLDAKYQGASATVAAASVLKITTPAGATDWGIKMTGNEHTFEPGIWRYDQFTFDIGITNFNATDITLSQAAYLGVGTYGAVAEAEWYAYGADALPIVMNNIPVKTKHLKAVDGKNYDWIVVSAFDNDYSNIHSRPESKFELLIAMPTACTQGDSAGSGTLAMGVATALDTWMTAKTGATYNEDSKLT